MTCGALPQPGRRWVKAGTDPASPGGQMGNVTRAGGHGGTKNDEARLLRAGLREGCVGAGSGPKPGAELANATCFRHWIIARKEGLLRAQVRPTCLQEAVD